MKKYLSFEFLYQSQSTNQLWKRFLKTGGNQGRNLTKENYKEEEDFCTLFDERNPEKSKTCSDESFNLQLGGLFQISLMVS